MPIQTMLETATLSPVRRQLQSTDLFMPLDVAEQTGLNAWALSTKNQAAPLKITEQLTKSPRPIFFKKKKLARSASTQRSASQSSLNDGSPLIRENYIEIEISNAHASHGSQTEEILLHFGNDHTVRLLGRPVANFERGDTIRWDFNTIQPYMETVPTDAWDELMLETESRDGIKIERITIVHSGETILDWNELVWLDDSRLEASRFISLTAQILQTKLDQIDHNWIAQIHWAAREIGKTDSTKYGTENAWCSEFASWALQKGRWGTPTGNFGSSSMENYFDSINRAHQVSEILDGSYTLNPGDYLRFEWASGGQHSGLFIDFIDDPENLTTSTRIKTIEGNTSSTVGVRTRRLSDVISCGNTR